MLPLAYEKINDWQNLKIITCDKRVLIGNFTSLRINRRSLPTGIYAYDVRNNEEGNIIEIKDFVLVNHWGTFVTSEIIPDSQKGIEIISFEYYDS